MHAVVTRASGIVVVRRAYIRATHYFFFVNYRPIVNGAPPAHISRR
jgi:hypothetical protein